jgi:hypothetical protein
VSSLALFVPAVSAAPGAGSYHDYLQPNIVTAQLVGVGADQCGLAPAKRSG